ncbi:AMP-binding protein [Dokdonella sp.]|uniref:AMP-binding protein n=1 Tax=Dokdonella sp. TaxID=2291710 RepID=UPI0031C6CD54|nr:AMP-binding protein [Dokdonella sp.]
MSAAVGTACGRGLPLLAGDDPARVVAWRQGRPVDVAHFLADVAGVAASLPEGRAAINLCEDRYAFVVAFCAALARGQGNLLPPSRMPRAVAEVLAANPASYALSEGSGAAHRILLADGVAEGPPASPRVAPAQIAVVGYTSGSTGQPKANPKSWRTLHACTARNAQAIAAAMGLAPGTQGHIVASVPAQHMYGLEMSVLLPLLGPFAVSSRHPLFPADVAAALSELPAPRVLVTTPVHLRALLRSGQPLPALAAIVSATAPLAEELARDAERVLGAPVLELFGSTETCVIAQRRSAHGAHWQPYSGVQLRPQPDGTLVDAPWFDQPVLLPDVVELLPGGQFGLRGRQVDLVEIAGKRASLADLTRRVLALAGVEDAVVFQAEGADASGVRRIAALVVAPGRSEAELLAELREAIDPAFLPRPLRTVAALPRNATGKLPRSALLAALSAPAIHSGSP